MHGIYFVATHTALLSIFGRRSPPLGLLSFALSLVGDASFHLGDGQASVQHRECTIIFALAVLQALLGRDGRHRKLVSSHFRKQLGQIL